MTLQEFAKEAAKSKKDKKGKWTRRLATTGGLASQMYFAPSFLRHNQGVLQTIGGLTLVGLGGAALGSAAGRMIDKSEGKK